MLPGLPDGCHSYTRQMSTIPYLWNSHPFTNRLEQRFSWGEVNLDLHVNEGMITEALLSSDSMEADWFSDIGTEFQGLPYRTDILCKALDHSLKQHLVPENIRADLCRMVQEQI